MVDTLLLEECLEEYINNEEATLRGLARKYGITRETIKRHLIKRGVKIRPCVYRKDKNLKIDIFSKIDSQEKAYWLGFLAADGCIHFNKTRSNGTVLITLRDIDRNHLELFKDFIGTSNKILDFMNYTGYSAKDGTPESRITVYSKQICEDLERIGVPPKKSLILRPPKIGPEYFQSYLSGFFDGDGTLYKTHVGKSQNISFTCGFTGTKEMLVWICDLVNEPDTNFTKRYKDNKNTYSIRWGGTYKPLRILESFYPKSPVHLERKYKLYQELKNVVYS